MNTLSRRSVTAGLAAAVTAIPALAICSSDTLEAVKRAQRDLEEALRRHYGAEVKTYAFDGTETSRPWVSFIALI